MSKLDELFDLNKYTEKDLGGECPICGHNHLDHAPNQEVFKQVAKVLLLELIEIEPCIENCTPERHAYHRGQYDLAQKLEKKINQL